MSDRRSSRRRFFAGLPRGQTLADLGLGGGASPARPAALAPRGTGLLHVTRTAMACDFTVFVRLDGWAGQGQHAATEAALAALDVIEAEEHRLSVYKPHSEISTVNRFAASRPVGLDDRLLDLLARGLDLSEQTGGAFDMTAGPLIRAWGFYRRQGRFPTDDELAEARAHVGRHYVALDRAAGTVALDHAGVELNLGAIGKGYALDVALDALTRAGMTNVLFQGGNSSLVARGDQEGARGKGRGAIPERESVSDSATTPMHVTPSPTVSPPSFDPARPSHLAPRPSRAGWLVGVRHPLHHDRRLGMIRLIDEACGTSGGGSQSFFHEGRRYPHILDPRTGRPATGMISATVIAPDAATADAVSTAVFVLGVDAAADYLATRPDLGALLMAERPDGGAAVHVLGRMKDAWEPAADA